MARKGRGTKTSQGVHQPRKLGGNLSKAERERLFDKLVRPHFTEIKSLAVRYTDKYADWEDNYILSLQQLYAYIHTYNPEKPLNTWIHIVVKRACYHQNIKQSNRQPMQSDITKCSQEALHQHGTSNVVDASFGNLIDNISDEVYKALLQIEPRRLSAFLLFAQGNSIREITGLEYIAGHLEQKNEAIIRSRIYWAQRQLRYLILKQRNGLKIEEPSHQGENSHQPGDTHTDGQEL